MITQFRMSLRLPDVSKRDLRIYDEVANAINFPGVHPAGLQPPHQPFRRLAAGPLANQSIEFFLILFSLLKRGKALIRQPFGRICRATETLPFLIVPTANHAPFTVVAWVTSVRRGRCVAIAVAVCNNAVCRVIKHRAADELHAGFKLRKIDVGALAGPPPMIQSCQHGDTAKGHRDEINIWSVEKVRWSIRLANQLRESAQR